MMNKKLLAKLFLCVFFSLIALNSTAQRRMEKLDRGVVVVRTATNSAFISWRLFGNEPRNVGFNLYKSVAGGTAVRLNSSVLTAGTNFTDNSLNYAVSNTYFVKPLLNGVEQAASGSFTLTANHTLEPCVVVPLKAGTTIHFVWVGDLDGDGEYDYVVDRLDFTNGGVKIEAYKHDGTFLWTMDMGPNSKNMDGIVPGSSCLDVGMWDGLDVYDMDGDGKAEVMVRTANGVIFGDGKTLTYSDDNTQFISVLDGMTGAERARAQVPNNYMSAGPMACNMGIGYLNGITPSLVTFLKNRNTDGSFNRLMCAWDFDGTTLSLKWKTNLPFGASYGTGSDGHQLRILDVDGDGKDEIGAVGFMLHSDGSLMYNLGDQGIYHGDRWFIGKMDPNRPGLQGYGIQQDNPDGLLEYYYDAGTGKVLWKHTSLNVGDVGRGSIGDIDPRSPGYEVWSFSGLYNGPSNTLLSTSSPYPNFRIWWDGDVLSENLNDQKIEKWDYNSSTISRLLTTSAYESSVQSDRSAPLFYGDIMGDWREEIVYSSSDYSKLVIFTSPYPTDVRLYTLAQNPTYRNCMSLKGYLQSHMLDYYLGSGMTTPPTPPMQSAKCVWKGNASNNVWDASITNWVVNGTLGSYTEGDDVMFDISGAPDTLIQVSGPVSPAAIKVISPINYSISGAGSITGSTKILKAGNGALSLNINCSYTDTTTVEEGALYMNGLLTQSTIVVSSMATIGGSGTISKTMKLNDGAMVSPGSKDNLGILTFASDLTLSNQSICLFDITNDSTGLIKPSDKMVVNGNLILAGISTIQVNKFNGVVKPGKYPLIVYSGTFTGDLSKVSVTGLFGQKYALTNVAGVISLTIEGSRQAAKVVWDGSANVWDLQTTPGWQLDNTQVTFVSNDSLVFDHNGANNTAVKVVGTLPVDDLTVETDSCSYYLSGTGNIGGTGGLTKNGKGTLSLLTTNTFTGKTVVNGGKLIIANMADAGVQSSIGAYAGSEPGGVVLNNSYLKWMGVTNTNTNKGLTLNGVSDTIDVATKGIGLTVQGVITGTANLVKTGAGILNLQMSSNTFKNTIVKAGVLSLGDETANTNGIGTGTLTLDGGTLTMSDASSTYTNFSTNIIVPELSTGTFNTDSRCNYRGTLTGGGTLNLYLPGAIDRTIFFGDWSAFKGIINVTGVASSRFRLANSFGYAAATINLGDNVSMYHGGTGTNGGDAVATTVNLGALSGTSKSTILGENWVIGFNNTDATFNGNITGNSLTKVGTGNMMLTDTCFYTASTSIVSGKLSLSSTGCIKGPVSVNATGTLAGTGVVKGTVSVNSTATIAPGNGSIGTLSLGADLTLQPGSKTSIKVSGSTNDRIVVTGTVVLNGTLEMINNGVAYKSGNSYTIFSAGTASGAFTDISPVIPAVGLKWNTSRIASGILSIDIADGIDDISEAGVRVYPTQVRDRCVVEFGSLTGDAKVELLDQVGKILTSVKTTTTQNYQLNLSTFRTGFYFVRITIENNQSCLRKVIKL